MRLWHMHGWFAGYVAPRAVSLTVCRLWLSAVAQLPVPNCHLQARLRCTPLACSPFVQVHVSTSGVLTLGYVTNAGAGYWKVLNSWGSSWG